jgi:hypothetical protein
MTIETFEFAPDLAGQVALVTGGRHFLRENPR